MSTVFTKIIDGELPGRFVWSDDVAVGFLSINPLGPGHTLVVSRAEVDQWVDADAGLLAHLTTIAHAIGAAVREIWQPPRVGLWSPGSRCRTCTCTCSRPGTCGRSTSPTRPRRVDDAEQDAHRDALRATLRDAGHGAHVPS